MFYSYKNQYPDVLPDRIRLSNGMTRTDKSTFTEEELIDAGYKLTLAKPIYDTRSQSLSWDGENWLSTELTTEQIQLIISNKWDEVRRNREELFKQVEWRFTRHFSELRLGLPPTDDIINLDRYVQELRDITKQEDPFNIIWPLYNQISLTTVNSL
jgi:hypothetical protein